MRATQAMAAETLAMTAATEAGQRADTADAAQMTAEDERDAANMRADTADAAQMTAEDERNAANMRADTADAAQMTAEDERDAANMRADTADAAQMTAEDERDAANTRADTADAAQMTAEDERDAANTRADTADAAQMTAEDERDAANTRADTADAAQMTAEDERDAANTRAEMAEAARDKLQQDLDDAKIDMEQATASGRAKGLAAAILGQDTADADRLTSIKVTRPVAGAIKVVLNEKDSGASDFSVADTTAPNVGDARWSGMMFENSEPDGATEHVTLYTDIETPKDKKFSDVYSELDELMLGVMDDVITHSALIEAGDFPAPGKKFTYEAPALGSTVTPEHVSTFAGTFHGLAGNYACAGDICSLANSNGKYTAEGDWTFTPNDRQGTVKVQDPDYIRFGWWQNTPDKAGADGIYTYTFQTFSGGSEAFAGAVRDVDGTATYKGPAAGRYVTQDPFAGTANAGSFTAKAELVADFDMAADGTSNGPSISGKVANFIADGQGVGWEVKLLPINHSDASFMGGMVEAKILSAKTDVGSWSGAFFGNGRSDGQPGSVAGEFDASFAGGADLAGAFGAHHTKADE